MTKEEKIQEVYKDYPNLIKHVKGDNGWCGDKFGVIFNKYKNNDLFDVRNNDYQTNGTIRPKSLQGIENNNGWIEIIKNENIPSGYYWILYSNSEIPKMGVSNGFSITQANLGLGLHPVIEITHYQPIINPLERLY
ncbi:hypothetical protein ACM55F_10060 [Flavobacterium sp. XS2P12]|uniref:hypothetical protein n=1 Tax=Flavobacterium melibiosi TaxID=3398734 RepID=UPI003A8B9A31